MVNQLLGVSSESQVNEISQLFSDFADGCLSIPIKLPGFAYDKAMKVLLLSSILMDHVVPIYMIYVQCTAGTGKYNK